MQIITLFASKGGAGRASTTLALAAGFLFHEKSVLMIDAGSNVEPQSTRKSPSLLYRWNLWIAQNLMGTTDLVATACSSPAELTQLLEHSRPNGIDVVIIDARASDAGMQRTSVARSDLVISSALSSEETRDALKAAPLAPAQKQKALGLLLSRPAASDVTERNTSVENLPLAEADLDALDVVVGQFALDDIAYHSDALDFGMSFKKPVEYGPARIACGAIVTRPQHFNQTADCGPVFLSPRGNLFEALPIRQ
ncbi:hypothetical protein [Ruegeria arenilitoris]|uniref:hypothetical protein n=1 Tax=Ruegeria arenilitoris TaxID=1173585 RepID=UPI00147C70BC|nr:hypothetical protein [Ruegeria arenilitoris]